MSGKILRISGDTHDIAAFIKTFQYIENHARGAFLPDFIRLNVGDARGINKDLYAALLYLSLSGLSQQVCDLYFEFQARQKSAKSDAELVDWFLDALSETGEALLDLGVTDEEFKPFKSSLNRLCRSVGRKPKFINLAAMAERLRKRDKLANSEHKKMREKIKQIIDKRNKSLEVKNPDANNRINYDTTSNYILLKDIKSFIDKDDKDLFEEECADLFRDEEERAKIKRKKRVSDAFAWILSALVCIGEAVVPAALALVAGVALPWVIAIGIAAYIVNILLFGGSQQTFFRDLFFGKFFKDRNETPMSKKQIVVATLSMIFCIAGALAFSCLSLSGFLAVSPLLLIPGACIATLAFGCYTALYYRTMLGLTKSNPLEKLKKFFYDKFVTPSWPMKLLNGLVLLIAVAATVAIVVFAFKYFAPLLIGFFTVQLGISLGIGTTIATVVNALSVPMLAFFTVMCVTALSFGVKNLCVNTVSYVADKIASGPIGQFCKWAAAKINTLVTGRHPYEPLIEPVIERSQNEKIFIKACETLAFSQRAKTVAKRLFLFVCMAFNSSGQGIGPAKNAGCLAVASSIGITETYATPIIMGTMTLNSAAAVTTGIVDAARDDQTRVSDKNASKTIANHLREKGIFSKPVEPSAGRSPVGDPGVMVEERGGFHSALLPST